MDFPKTQEVALRLVAQRYADRAGAVPGSIITAPEFINAVIDEILAVQAAAGIAAVEGQNDQLADAIRVLARGGALGFLVKPQVGPTLSVDIGAGTFFNQTTGLLVLVAATNAGPIVAPVGQPRHDIVYIDALTGAPGIQEGVENVAPVDPALPAGKLPAGRINAYVGMTEILAADIDELRYLGSAGIDPFTAKLAGRNLWTAGQAAAPVALVDAAPVAVDLAAADNFSLLMTAAVGATRALGAPTNQVAGQSGLIVITQDGVGARLLTYAVDWKFEAGLAPVLSTGADAVDQLAYYVVAPGQIHAYLTKGWA